MSAVVTGMGAVTPLGIGLEETWQALKDGKNGVGPITLIDPKNYNLPATIAAEVKGWDPKTQLGWLRKKELDRQHRCTQFADFATHEARKQAGLEKLPNPEGKYDKINLVGTGGGGNDRYEEMTRAVDEGRHIHPTQLIQSIFNSVLSGFAKTAEHDQAFPFSTACATGADSASVGVRLLADTTSIVPCRIVYAGGTEAPICATSLKGFWGIKTLSRRNNPVNSSRPFSKGRDGFVMGEGAVVLILEDEKFARNRGAKPLARLVGWSSICRPGHPTKPSLKDIVESISRALRQARLHPKDIDLIVAHGTSTKLNDAAETLAIKKVLGDHAYKVPITGPKSMVGHMLGAAGAFGMLVAVQSLITEVVPPTINYKADPECDLDFVPNHARLVKPRRVMVNAFGFGNQNCCLIFELFEDWMV